MPADLNRPNVLIAAAATGTAGALVFAMLPILAGQIADQFGLDDAQTGLVSSSYFLVYSMVSLTAPLWIRRFNWRHIASGGFATLLLGLGMLYVSRGVMAVIGAMAVAGAGAAVLLPVSLALVADMHNKERAYGIVTALQQLVPAALLLGVSLAWFGTYHLTTTTCLIAIIVVLSLLCSAALPNRGNPPIDHPAGQPTSVAPAVVGLVGLGLNFSGFAGMWTFLERIAASSNLEQEFTTRWIAIGLFMTVLGPLVSAALGNRVPRAYPLTLPAIVCISSLFLLQRDTTATAFATALLVFPLTYYISLSFILSVIADADRNGRILSLMSFALACGALIGPAVFGVLRESSPNTALIAVACAIGSGTGLILWADKQET